MARTECTSPTQVRERQDIMDEEYMDLNNTMTSLVFEEELEREFNS